MLIAKYRKQDSVFLNYAKALKMFFRQKRLELFSSRATLLCNSISNKPFFEHVVREDFHHPALIWPLIVITDWWAIYWLSRGSVRWP